MKRCRAIPSFYVIWQIFVLKYFVQENKYIVNFTRMFSTSFTGVIHLDNTQSMRLSGAHASGGALEIREDGRCVVGVSSMSCRGYFKDAFYGSLITFRSHLHSV